MTFSRSWTVLIVCVFCSTSSKETATPFIDADQIKKDPNLQKQVDNNNGAPISIGQHAYLVLFMKKSSSDGKSDKESGKGPTDFSLRGPFFCSGTLITDRWALTRATPIASYPVGSYWMVAQRSIATPIRESTLKKYDVDAVLIHPDHKQGDNLTDVAMVRASKSLNFDFETRNANMEVGGGHNFQDCQLPVWSWLFRNDSKKESVSIERSHIVLSQTQDCPNGESHLCLSESGAQHKPCGINSGAPIICGSIFLGVYVGSAGDATCNSTAAPKTLQAIKLSNDKTKKWLDSTLTDPDLLLQTEDTDDEDAVPRLQECPTGGGTLRKLREIVLVLSLLKYMF